jgi:type I restriction enzyme S subunit
MRVRLNEKRLLPAYVEIYYQVGFVREDVLKNAKSSAGQNGISGKDLKDTTVLIPPIEEQKEIVRKVEELFHFADSIEARYQKAKAWFDKLPQSILAKAFRGELVPQDENDEPASELLKCIQQAKQTNLPVGKAGYKPSSKAKKRKLYEDNDGLSLVAEE